VLSKRRSIEPVSENKMCAIALHKRADLLCTPIGGRVHTHKFGKRLSANMEKVVVTEREDITKWLKMG
jgi:phage baseplate assembly protein W